uniref:hypothetical protein n=1 Tax=uncultured Coprobacter sp. TaxID=1720550 RepID=UPI002614CE56
QRTPNGLINVAQPILFDEVNFFAKLSDLYEAAYAETDDMKALVSELVPTYHPDSRSFDFLHNQDGLEDKPPISA